MKKGFPKIIKDLPEADMGFKGVRAWMAQGETHQILFIETEPVEEESEHSHESPFYVIVLEGKVEQTISNTTEVYEKGDEYFIPARTKHSAKFLTRCRGIAISFREKASYQPK